MSLLQRNALVSSYKSKRDNAECILTYTPIKTAVGCLFVAYYDEVLCLISVKQETAFLENARQILKILPIRKPVLPKSLTQSILKAVQGQSSYSTSIDLSGLTYFQRKVLEQTQEIPRGEVRSYAWVAQAIGHPKANRAVGTALARNPLPFVIPCHRVIRSDGQLGAYSSGGSRVKEWLLAQESVNLRHLYDFV